MRGKFNNKALEDTHPMLVNAMRPYKGTGKQFTKKEIEAEVLKLYPNVDLNPATSRLRPSDHISNSEYAAKNTDAGISWCCCNTPNSIFERIGRGRYRVL